MTMKLSFILNLLLGIISIALFDTTGAFAPQYATRHVHVLPLPVKHSVTQLYRHNALLMAASASDELPSSFKLPTFDNKEDKKKLASAAAFVLIDIFFKRAMAQISFPSSLTACGCLFATLLALPSDTAKSLYNKLSAGAVLLAKWLPLFFVPSLITLPLADPLGSWMELVKVGGVIIGGFLFTLLTTAWSVVAVRRMVSKEEDRTTAEVAPSVDNTQQKAPKPFSDELFNLLLLLTGGSGTAAVLTTLTGTATAVSRPLTSLFMLFTTLTTFVFGARLPKTITKMIHPLVTCTVSTWTAIAAFCVITGPSTSFRSMLRSYTTRTLGFRSGPGDLLLFLLGPAVVSLAISMYERRKLMRDNLAAVGTAVGVSTVGGIFGTALAVRILQIGNPALRLSLLSRNITSPLAMAIAGILGADVSLAVSMVVVTGLIGANFGASILDAFGIKDDAVARGLSIGAAAHGLGTAAFANEKNAFPFAAIAMALTASAATVTVSIPLLKRIIMQIALGW